MLSSLRASPPLYLISASVCSKRMFRLVSSGSVVTARCISDSRSSLSSDFRTYSWQRDSSGRITSNEGFSVVAPISVTTPFSTAPRSESCCDLEKRWISSMKSIGDAELKKRPLRARSITSRTSFTPLVTALSVKNGVSRRLAIICARVVLPTPGGPQSMNEEMCPESIILRNTPPSPTK